MSTLMDARPGFPLSRRLSMSSDSQWTSKGRSVPSSGYALSPSTSSSALSALAGGPSAPGPSPSQASTTTATATPSSAAANKLAPYIQGGPGATRQLNPASIFERLGLLSPTTPTGRQTLSGTNTLRSGSTSSSRDTSTATTPALSSSSSSSRSLSSSATSHTYFDNETARLPEFDGMHLGNHQAITPREDASTPTLARRPSSSSAASEDGEGLISTPTNMVPIESDILLPFADRPTEIRELLEREEKNKGLYQLLKETFTPKSTASSSSAADAEEEKPDAQMASSPLSSPSFELESGALSSLKAREVSSTHARSDSLDTVTSSSPSAAKKWDFAALQAHLAIPRHELGDQEWIDGLKARVYPRSQLLWERLRACLGVDVDDEQGGDRFEPLSSDIDNDPGNLHLGPQGAEMLLRGSADVVGRGGAHADPPTLSPRAVLHQAQLAGQQAPHFAHLPASFSAFDNPSPFAPRSASDINPNPNTNSNSLGMTLPSSSSVSSSPVRQTQPIPIPGEGARSPSTRMHRRTSSGGSSFRRSFAMSSIDEDRPLDSFADAAPAPPVPLSAAANTPDLASDGSEQAMQFPVKQRGHSNDSSPERSPLSSRRESSQLQNRAGSGGGLGGGAVELGSLLRLKGYSLNDPTHPNLGKDDGNSSAPPSAPAVPGHLPPPTPLTPSSSTSASSSSFASGLPWSPISASQSPTAAFRPGGSAGVGSALMRTDSASSSSLGPSRSASFTLAGHAGHQASPYAAPGRGATARGGAGKAGYDEYVSVFGSEDSMSVSGSAKSRGHGPGMRFSFGSQDAARPGMHARPGGGFALAGLDFNKPSKAKRDALSDPSSAAASTAALADTSGVATPRGEASGMRF